MLFTCSVHGGYVPGIIYSPRLLERRADGTVPEIVPVQVIDDGDVFFAFITTPEEAEKFPVIDGSIPFEAEPCWRMASYPSTCVFCFDEKRQALLQLIPKSE